MRSALSIGTAEEAETNSPRRRRLGELLKAKRANLEPDSFGLPIHRRRRVAGLRREEVALLAGISVTWYTQLESGANITVSPALIGRLATVLELTALERAYLFTLAFDELGAVEAVLPELEMLAGARIAAETFAGEIGLVLRAHRSLKSQIYSSLLHGKIDALLPHLDEGRCPIGFWLHDDLSHHHRSSAEYTRAARIHVAFHREIDKVVSAGCTGVPAHVERLIAARSRYVLASEALERAFSAWGAQPNIA
jgi:transcriptional regulator with XRE-family HTH domain